MSKTRLSMSRWSLKAGVTLAAALASGGIALGTSSTANAAVAETPSNSTAAAAGDVGTMGASCRSSNEANWLVPDGEDSWAGYLYWEDYNEYTGNDQDNFYLDDRNLDAQSSSYSVTNNYTGKTYYKHVYNGEAYCMGVGNIPNGHTASWKICGWNGGDRLECDEGKIEE